MTQETFEQIFVSVVKTFPRLYESTNEGEWMWLATRLLDELTKRKNPIGWACWVDGSDPEIDKPMLCDYEPKAYPLRKPLYVSPFVAAPAGVTDGWSIKRDGDVILVQKDGVGGYVARQNEDNIASEILYWLADSLLSAAPAAPADAVAKDAERYRWLKENCAQTEQMELDKSGDWPAFVNISFCREGTENIDAAIDAAMQGKEGK